MTPERLQQIRRNQTVDLGPLTSDVSELREGYEDLSGERRDLLNHIDLLHEDLRLTRAERDAEKKKNMVEAKGNALPEGARTMPDGSIRLGNRDYLKRKDTK